MTTRRFVLILFLLTALMRGFAAWGDFEDRNVDEVVSAYEAFSLAETGRDRTGAFLPLYFFNLGFGENATYSYLLALLFKVFGIQDFLTPFPSWIFNTAAVGMFYFLLRYWFSEKLARWASMLLAISPWHLMLTSYEYNVSLVPLLLFTGLWGFMKAVCEHKVWGLIVALICFVTAMYTYGIPMLLLPLEIFVLLFFFFPAARRMRWNILWVSVLGLLLVTPLLLFMLTAMSGQISFWPGSFPILEWVRTNLFIPIGTPLGITLFLIVRNISAIFSLEPWFWNLDFYTAPQNIGLLWLWEAPLIVMGLIVALRRRKNSVWKFLFWWGVVGLLPSLLMQNEFHPHPWRLIFLLGIGEILAAQGIVAVWDSLFSFCRQKIFYGVLIFLFSGSSLLFFFLFSQKIPLRTHLFRQGGIATAMEILFDKSKNTNRVMISDSKNQYYIFYLDVLWYGRRDPQEFQKIFSSLSISHRGYLVPKIGKFSFCYAARGCSIKEEYQKNPQGLWMVRGDELTDLPAIVETSYPDGTKAFRFIQTQP